MRLGSLLFALALAGCDAPSADATFVATVPERASFPLVAQALVAGCGTLDCHGTAARNLRLYGNTGLRSSSSDRPLTPPCTTSVEIDEDFASVVGLEPEAMSAVVKREAAPDTLSLVRKPRGLESHKGGTLMAAGDDRDACITGWLSGAPNLDACARIAPPTVPPPATGQTPACEPGP